MISLVFEASRTSHMEPLRTAIKQIQSNDTPCQTNEFPHNKASYFILCQNSTGIAPGVILHHGHYIIITGNHATRVKLE
jgi:hypothetical protein